MVLMSDMAYPMLESDALSRSIFVPSLESDAFSRYIFAFSERRFASVSLSSKL